MKTILMTAAVTLAAGAAFAESHVSGDAAAGKKVFRQCQSCHVVRDDDGNVLAGKASKTGPNLYGRPGAMIFTEEGFRYSKDSAAAGETGMTWDEATFVEYVQDPTAFLRKVTDNSKARSKMTFKVRKEQDAKDVWAFLVSLSPMMDMEDADSDGDES